MATARPDWNALRRSLDGDLVLPDDDGYDAARVVALRQFDHIRPQAVVLCRTEADVREAVRFVRSSGLRCVPRSGGHSNAGYTAGPGVVIDLSRMAAVELSGAVVRAEAGAQVVDVYDRTLREDLAVPLGWCATVAVGGLAQGGGIGLECRAHGLTVDHVLAARVVLADGRVVECDADRHPDLFWALRGGGGGNFGVVTEFTLRAVPVPRDVVSYTLIWPWSVAEDVVDAWQRWAPEAPDALAAVLNIGLPDATEESEPRLRAAGVWFGDPDDFAALRAELVERVGAEPEVDTVITRSYRDTLMAWFDCEGFSVAECHTVGHNPLAKLTRYAFALARGNFVDRVLPRQGVRALLAAFDDGRFPGQARDLDLIAFGGAANRVPPDATAFAHRAHRFYAGYSMGMDPHVTDAGRRAGEQWIDRCFAVVRLWGSGHSYQNFLDPKLPDWQHAYYGENYPRLRRVKAAYDPEGFFAQPRSIEPP
ncbi:FAD/FMN-containing dehydrogenase [Streptoalloteichus tenebrarius]|uniref:FAD/FMN-containing dehydrogenase n=1 Tax=Streptoalloteichus tenebrarius (strain ATCC 17920 / DSM 40477 / JCM 4838 / CBS 697.72 / NBRC 16177 / NCIMB 11028 / NRRL B-12390 / A12253. 1 / ISP 5477) TaxID=1933 RepID=A0ABT1HQN5_STRSD|nr:FAD-binding oxidoreductase [Streptoalloteichus tenebrarius]MCP2257824.1 FAD/FMN-containing dehydrogenase [Streptoalloteichus tenebrarius]BFE99813.1 FAD-binding oxidoreductase [Streptoalloteichus tenebrarius]